MNLYVCFEEVLREEEDDHRDNSGLGFVTPGACKQNNNFSALPRFKQKTPYSGSYGFSKNMFSSGEASIPKRRCVTEAPAVNLDDVDFVREAERVEAEMKGGGRVSEGGVASGGSDGEDEVTREEIDDMDIRPRGYDKDFWSPLLSGDYGGSNAVNVIYNEDEIVDGIFRKSGPRYFSSNTQPIPHAAVAGGSIGGFPEREVDSDGHQGFEGVDGETRTRTRKL